MSSESSEIVARFRSRVWESEDGQCVILRADQAGGKQRPVTLKGAPDAGPKLVVGLAYRWLGKWETHPQHGDQFLFASFLAVRSEDRGGVLAYLEACAEGVGPKRAEHLWDRYGPLAVETLRTNPEAVAEAGILTAEAATAASESLKDHMAFEETKVELFGLLAGRGFQLSVLIRELLRRWGRRSPDIIRSNPYRLLGMPSAGWARTDKLYLDLGKPAAALKRQALCAWNALRSDTSGDTWLPADRIAAAIRIAVGAKADAKRALRLAIRAGLIARHHDKKGTTWLADGRRAENEALVAEHVRRLSQ